MCVWAGEQVSDHTQPKEHSAEALGEGAGSIPKLLRQLELEHFRGIFDELESFSDEQISALASALRQLNSRLIRSREPEAELELKL